MTHTNYLLPFNLWVTLFKFMRKHICCFSNNFYALNDGILEDFVVL